MAEKNPNLFSEALEKLLVLLNDANPDVQAWAADALGSLANVIRKNKMHTRIVSKLIEMLESPFPFTRICATETLGKIGDPSALNPLKKLLDKETEEIVVFKREKWIKAKDIVKEAIENIKNKNRISNF